MMMEEVFREELLPVLMKDRKEKQSSQKGL
jgi:hypothetical protein